MWKISRQCKKCQKVPKLQQKVFWEFQGGFCQISIKNPQTYFQENLFIFLKFLTILGDFREIIFDCFSKGAKILIFLEFLKQFMGISEKFFKILEQNLFSPTCGIDDV